MSSILLALTALAMLLPGEPVAQISHQPGFVLSGLDHELFGPTVAAAGDVNADGFNDVMTYAVNTTGGTYTGKVRVNSGRDGELLLEFTGIENHPFDGIPMAGVGDVNGDGHGDVIIGNSFNSLATLHSGRDGAVIHTYRGIGVPGEDGFGGSVAGAGDVDGDTVPDVIVGSVGFGGGIGEYAIVFSGDDGRMLHSFEGTAAGDRFGTAVNSAGDVNHDGHADLIVAAYGDGTDVLNPGVPPFFPPFWTDDNAGAVSVFSGLDGTEIFTTFGDIEEIGLGWSAAPVGDVNDDGVPDILVSNLNDGPFPSDLSSRAYSGATGDLLFSYSPDTVTSRMAVTGLGDINGDGIDDFAVGVSQSFIGGGYVQVFVSQGLTSTATVYGCGVNPEGSMAVVSGQPSLDQSVTLGLDDPGGSMATPATAYLLVSTAAATGFPCGTPAPDWGLSAPGAPGELLVNVTPPNPLFILAVGTYTGTQLEVELSIPENPVLAGERVYLQGALVDGSDRVGLTDAVELVIGLP